MRPQNLLRQPLTTQKCTLGCPILDRCLGGAIPCNSITELVAESGSGKTQLCLQLSLSAQLPASHGGLSASSLSPHRIPFPFPSPPPTEHKFPVFLSLRGDQSGGDLVAPDEGINGLRVGNLGCLYSSGRRVCPALGLAWANCVNSRLFLTKDDEFVHQDNQLVNGDGGDFVSRRTRRWIHVVFAPHLPNLSCEFEITRKGIFGVER
ncbi:hypothetical protein LWI29_036960 [Acer saccharum]|uniref:RecA family profile 1 domain-containing protein n=1 Tax=Acer saccharum TaxID=4024 RepID=A0AA39UMQ5_ACESA|nr:hypothetical protein LWI29_036960 [Acer saccharum]